MKEKKIFQKAFYPVGTGGTFQEIKRPVREADR
jgi:hypothetical protein